MSRNYKFHNPTGLYFVSFAVVGWLDVFTRNEYKDLLLDSLEFCQKNKGMEIHAWCIMTSHVHLIFRSIEKQNPELLLGDYKRFTSRSIIKAIQENPRESRKEFLLDYFKKEAIAWAWELLHDVNKKDADRMYVTVFEGNAEEKLAFDQEA